MKLTPKQTVAAISAAISLVAFGVFCGSSDLGWGFRVWFYCHVVLMATLGILWLLGELEPKLEATQQEG